MIFAPILTDDVARRYRFAPIAGIEGRRREALLLLRDINQMMRPDVCAKATFIGDAIIVASMVRWQPELQVQAVGDFIKEVSEAIEYRRRVKGEVAA